MITISFVNFAALEATEDKHVNADENSTVTKASMMRLIAELLSMTFCTTMMRRESGIVQIKSSKF
jgi:hypothetical protein